MSPKKITIMIEKKYLLDITLKLFVMYYSFSFFI